MRLLLALALLGCARPRPAPPDPPSDKRVHLSFDDAPFMLVEGTPRTVPDAQVDEVGRRLGQAAGVNLCYQRPRRLPQWPYNLFCMVHGREREQVCQLIERLLADNGLSDVPHQLLFSTRAFKQCGGRFAPPLLEVANG